MIKIVADNKIPFLRGALDGVAKVSYLPGKEITRDSVIGADALIIRTRTCCNGSLLEGTGVKFIATATIGYDHIDTDYCRSGGIEWTNAPGCNSGSVMQYIASALASITSPAGKNFSEMTLGIIGVGNVGSKVENLAHILGMKVLLNDPPRERRDGGDSFTSLDRLLEESDIVTMHVPLNVSGPDKSHHLADGNFFRRMKSGAWFINTSRGEVVNSGALLDTMNKGGLSGIVLDVWENEPDINTGLLSLAEIATPHIAGYSLDGKANGTAQSVRAISRYFSLGMDNWYPESIPSPSDDLVNASAGESFDQLVRRLFLHTYDIYADSLMLKTSPHDFEKLRDNYPPRREFSAYKIYGNFERHSDAEMLRRLGFSIDK